MSHKIQLFVTSFTENWVVPLDLLSRRNFSSEFKNHLLRKRKSVTKRDRKLVEDLKLHEERGFLRRMAVPLEYGNLYSNTPQPVKRPHQKIKSSLWRNISKFWWITVHLEVKFYRKSIFRLDLYSAKVDAKVREDIDKYKQFGSAKKQLYSMPQYFAYRERKGIKLPANKINQPTNDKEKIKVRGGWWSSTWVDISFISVRRYRKT